MAVILEVTGNNVLIGTDDGGMKEVELSNLDFYPEIGEEVQIYENETKVFVTRKRRSNRSEDNSQSFTFTFTEPKRSNNLASLNDGRTSVNKVIYCILCICLGGFGAHKFYAQHITTGLLYLLFCWTGIPYIIAIVEFFIALGQPADENGMIII